MTPCGHGTVSEKDVHRAYRLRRALASGGTLSPDRAAWLAAYSARPTVARKAATIREPWRRAQQSLELVAARYRVPRGALLAHHNGRAPAHVSWPRAVLAWCLVQTGHTYEATGRELGGISYQAIQSRLRTVEKARERSDAARAETDALIARRPTVTLTIEVGSALWCLFDQIDMELDATWHALSYRAAADQVAE